MIIGDGTHGYWCNSKTYPTRCKFCGEKVFYFTCDHGSKVFFDSLGVPWPLHDCFERKIAEHGADVIARGLATMMMTPGIDIGPRIDTKYAEKVINANDAPREPEIVRCDPRPGDIVEEDGIVREIIQRVNLFKRFKTREDSLIGRALLGELANRDWAQLTIHTGSLGGDDNFSYTFLVDRKLFGQKGPIKGDFVSCRLRAYAVPRFDPLWVCDDLRGMFG